MDNILFESSRDCIKILDRDGRFLSVNKNGLSALGIPDFSKLQGRRWLDLWTGENQRAVMTAVEQAGRGGESSFRLMAATPEGTSVLWDVMVTPVMDVSGVLEKILVVSRDVTNIYRAELAQRESETRLHFILESAEIGEWELDLETQLAKRSLRHDQCFGYTEPVRDWGSEEFFAHLHPQDRQWVASAFATAIEEEKEMSIECRVIWPDQSEHWISTHGCIYHPEDAGPKMLGVISDITARKAQEQFLRDNDRQKDEFLAMLAHELRNPLAPISAAANFLSRSAGSDPQVKRMSAILLRQASHMERLIEDLVDVSRVTQGLVRLVHAPVDMQRIIADSVDQAKVLMASRNQHLATDVCQQPHRIYGDEKRLVQVIGNLLNNAAKYTPQFGNISLRTQVTDQCYQITIKDDGIGMSQQLAHRAFDLFSQEIRSSDRTGGGLGVGLALVKSIVALHGGTVSAHSAGTGLGSEFTVSLPLVNDNHTDDADAVSAYRPIAYEAAPPITALRE